MSLSKIVVFVASVIWVSTAIADDPTESLVHVSGKGMVRVIPDQVIIELTLTTTDDDLIRVRETSDKDARTILVLTQKHGVEAGGFEVESLELSLDYSDQLRRQIYQVEREVALRLSDLSKLDALLADLLKVQNLNIDGVSFVTSESRQHEFEARRLAVVDAKEKGVHLATLNGFKLGKARDIRVLNETRRPFVTSVIPTVGSSRTQNPNDRHLGSKIDAKNIAKSIGLHFVTIHSIESGGKDDVNQFALGMIEIVAEVEIDFELAE